MEELERHDIYFVDREGKREVRDPLPYYGTLEGAKNFCLRYFDEVGSRYVQAQIYRMSDAEKPAATVVNPHPK